VRALFYAEGEYNPMADDSAQIATFEKMGEAAVRLHVNNAGFSQTIHRLAINWLAQKDQESARLIEASQAEQTEIARSSKDAAWAAARAAERAATAAEKANTRAIIALAIAATSIAGTIVNIWLVHRDTTATHSSAVYSPFVSALPHWSWVSS
jgi:hypothetical protein